MAVLHLARGLRRTMRDISLAGWCSSQDSNWCHPENLKNSDWEQVAQLIKLCTGKYLSLWTVIKAHYGCH